MQNDTASKNDERKWHFLQQMTINYFLIRTDMSFVQTGKQIS
jgi:hypothetical protein